MALLWTANGFLRVSPAGVRSESGTTKVIIWLNVEWNTIPVIFNNIYYDFLLLLFEASTTVRTLLFKFC